jgi:hypothetical protein
LNAPSSRRAAPTESEEEQFSRAIVATLFACPELVDDPTVQASLTLVAGDWAFAVVELREEMRKSRRENRAIDGSSLLARLPESIQKFSAATLVAPSLSADLGAQGTLGGGEADVDGSRASEGEGRIVPLKARSMIRENGAKLAKLVAAERSRELDREIAKADAAGDFARATTLLAEKNRLLAAARNALVEAQADAEA